MLRTKARPAERGFTIIELMVVVGLMAIVIGVAAVSIADSLRKGRLQTATREIEGEIALIRNTARTQQRRVTAQVTANRITAFYDNNRNGVYDAAIDYIDSNGNGIFDAGTDASGMFFGHTYTNGVQFGVTSGAAVGAILPLTTIQFNEMGNIIDVNRIITVTMNGETNRRYRMWIYTTGSTRVERSDDAGATWPTRPW